LGQKDSKDWDVSSGWKGVNGKKKVLEVTREETTRRGERKKKQKGKDPREGRFHFFTTVEKEKSKKKRNKRILLPEPPFKPGKKTKGNPKYYR